MLKYWVWVSSVGGVGSVTAARLIEHFGSPEKVFFADPEECRHVKGVRQADIAHLRRKSTEEAGRIIDSCADIGCRVLTLQDAEYPDMLRNTYDPPIVLYVRGTLPLIDEKPAVAVVGTRDCTPYGLSTAGDVGYRLARRGLIVVTGLARGVDTAAAKGALKGGGRVVGIIGSGQDVVYPPENKELFDEVVRNGAIISEYPPGTQALPSHFPARNRIISGLSLGVAVLEAPKKSGALITAARALEQGRDVFAMPGNVDSKSCLGSNLLLREGAIPILSGDDIASEYEEMFPDAILPDEKMIPAGAKSTEMTGEKLSIRVVDRRDSGKKEIDNKQQVEYIDLDKVLSGLSGDEKAVAKTIGHSALHVDEIVLNAGLKAAQVQTALTMLEIKGYAVRNGGVWRMQNAECRMQN